MRIEKGILDGKWKMVDGKRKMVDGKRKMEDGKRLPAGKAGKMGIGYLKL